MLYLRGISTKWNRLFFLDKIKRANLKIQNYIIVENQSRIKTSSLPTIIEVTQCLWNVGIYSNLRMKQTKIHKIVYVYNIFFQGTRKIKMNHLGPNLWLQERDKAVIIFLGNSALKFANIILKWPKYHKGNCWSKKLTKEKENEAQ